MHVGLLFGESLLKISAELDKLIDHMGDLTALIKILHSLVRVAAIFVANVVTVIFLPVKPFIFNFPAKAPGIAY